MGLLSRATMLSTRQFRPDIMTRPASRCCASLVPEGQGTAKGPFMKGTWEENGYETSSHNGAPKIYSPWNKWFPYEPVPHSPKLGPYKVWCNAGELYHWCACGESRTQPWCECGGEFNAQRGFRAVPYVPRVSGWKLMSGSKHRGMPLFDGTCWLVWIDVNFYPACAIGLVTSFIFGICTTWLMSP